MECGGKRSATPLWMPSPFLKFAGESEEKRRRASLAAALYRY